MDSFNDVLDAAKAYCREHTADATYQYYISGLKAVSFENSNCITLEVRNDFICKIVSDRYTGLLKDAFKAVLGFDVEVKFTVPQPEPEAAKEKRPMDEANPSGAYNPLFIYGPSGLGKTHLLNAIQIEIHKNHPDYNIVYVDCEKFTNEIITAVKMATTEQFRQKYREADVLLIDDIQFLAGKESTQEEFFHTFNTLHNAGKQIVLASDRPAKEIKSLEERLRTRFEWGLTADIQPPDFETRVAIVKRKAELLNLDLPDDVAEYIANHLKQNIRQLEGAVKKLNAYYMLEGIAPCIGVTTTAIKDTLNDTQPIPVTIEKIINEVARTYNVIPSDIRGKKRSANVSAARQMSMYIIREITGMSMEAIGSEFQRDHSTVVYSINTMEKNIGKDRHLKETVDDIMKNIRA